jgi:enoyl-CoA hydratase
VVSPVAAGLDRGGNGAAPEPPRVLLEHDGPVRIVTLNRPAKLNAADLPLHEAFAAVWDGLAADPDVRAVVVTGAGRAFSAGGDRAVLEAMGVDAEFDARLHDLTVRQVAGILELPWPVVAAVNGPAIGFGAALVAVCDLVVMAEDAYLAEPHSWFGIDPSPGLALVWPHLTSLAVAKELTMLGRRVTADEALRWGLANRVAPAGEVVAAAVALAHELAAIPASGLTGAKRALNAVIRPAFEAWRDRPVERHR